MSGSPRLTQFSHGAGCGCKLGPDVLARVMGDLSPVGHPDLLVGTGTGDDAAVWKLDDDRALVVTTDFFTPVVDDAHTWGRIAATNALSDVYAMGGRPLLALNLVAWNVDALGTELLGELLRGGGAAVTAAGAVIAGGHSIDDPEPKYGLAVVGEVHPNHLLTNAGLRVGDALVLTKPLGVGVVTTAIKRDLAAPDVIEHAVATMTTLNDAAADSARASGASGCTDVTGFGLLGHLGRMAAESGVDVELDIDAIPVLDGVPELIRAGAIPGGTARNLAHVIDRVDAPGRPDDVLTILGDPQTSGGLLFGASDATAAAAAAQHLSSVGPRAAAIGRVVGPGTGRIRLR